MTTEGTQKVISVTHLNIRPSISMLILKLVLLDTLGAVVIIGGYLLILSSPTMVNEILKSYIGLVVVWVVFIFQIVLTIYTTLQWINEYYELTPNSILHKKGLIWRKIEKYSLDNLTYMSIDQGLIGTLLNYGTITFLSPRREKLLELYSIHNPNKYFEVLEHLKPKFGRVENIIRGEVAEDDVKVEEED